MRKHIWWMPGAFLAVVLVGQLAAYRTIKPTVTLKAVWAYKPNSIKEAKDKGHTAVKGIVLTVANGPDLMLAMPGEPGGKDKIPTQRITLRVDKPYKGMKKEGNLITVFRTGGEVRLPPGEPKGKENHRLEGVRVVVEDDPPYKVSEEYVMLMEDGPAGTMRPVSPEGRYRIEGGKVKAMVQNDVTSVVEGKGLAELEKHLE